MASPDDQPNSALFQLPMTFMGLPYSTDVADASAAILGCPFDCGTHPFRVGERQGPQAIREQSGLIRRYQSEIADTDPLTELGAIDAGDVRLVPSRAKGWRSRAISPVSISPPPTSTRSAHHTTSTV